MNTTIYYSFNILIFAALIFVIGMFKPKWILLWMDKPGRMPIAVIASVLFMIGMVMFGEGNKQMQEEKAKQNRLQSLQSAETPVVAPTPVAATITAPVAVTPTPEPAQLAPAK